MREKAGQVSRGAPSPNRGGNRGPRVNGVSGSNTCLCTLGDPLTRSQGQGCERGQRAPGAGGRAEHRELRLPSTASDSIWLQPGSQRWPDSSRHILRDLASSRFISPAAPELICLLYSCSRSNTPSHPSLCSCQRG